MANLNNEKVCFFFSFLSLILLLTTLYTNQSTLRLTTTSHTRATSISPSHSVSVRHQASPRMAVPSSSHHDRDREREREREHRHRSERHHHHRTISSTTLLLVLSLVLAVLAVMLSLPATSGGAAAAAGKDEAATGIWGYLNPKRSQVLVTRERDVAMREAEVARREAELLVGAPGGVIPSCPPCSTQTIVDIPPAQTIIKEVVKEQELVPPGWWKEASGRAEETLERELKVNEREREVTRREESVNRREHDASRREAWIMEQLVSVYTRDITINILIIFYRLINSDGAAVEEEVYYEQPGPKRKLKVQQPASALRRPEL